MKNLLTYAVAVALATATLASCKKDEDKVTISPSTSLTLTGSANSVVLAQINDEQNALTYTWNPVQFSLSDATKALPVTYQIQVAKTPDGFGNPGVIDAGDNTRRTVTVLELNDALNKVGVTTGSPTPAYVRVAAVIGGDNHTFASAPIILTATAYPACFAPNADTWGLVGPAGNGWPANPPDVQTDLTMKWNCALQAYTLRTRLNVGDFKFRQNKKWDVDLGGSGTLAQGVPLTRGGSNLSIATAGIYTVKLTVTGSGNTVSGGTVTVTP
jgi:hypothetical protein